MKISWKCLFFVSMAVALFILADRYIYDIPFIHTGSSEDFYVLATMALSMVNSGIHLWREVPQTQSGQGKKIR